ncbi:MAG: hypothetical protein SGILL_005171, partial [Bacillariaceae sp.]
FLSISSVDPSPSLRSNGDDGPTHGDHHSASDNRRRLTDTEEQVALDQKQQDHLTLFTVSDEVSALGPTSFPEPTRIFEHRGNNDNHENEYVIHLQPTHGQHRPDQDAVFLFAAEYSLQNYLVFLSTLRQTADFTGDVVMGLSKMDWQNDEVRQYLQHDPHVIVYVVDYTCFNAENEAVESAKGGIRVCQCDNLYGRKQEDGTVAPLKDPRHARTLQNSRYELYWIWSTHYENYSWIMLIDARDTIFQLNPFDLVPRHESASKDKGGLLLFFGENVEATRLGKSKHNRDWLTKAYGPDVANALAEKPTICSGSTMGEQKAIEMYLRAMVVESDETKTVKMGADQGFHNRLYYSSKLANADAIREIIVQDQGFGLINNLGALRIKPLNEWFNGKLLQVVRADSKGEGGSDVTAMNVRNWDLTLSPVVHQFDRHKELSNWYFKHKKREFLTKWNDYKKSQQKIAK